MFKKIGAVTFAVAPLSSFAAVPTDISTALTGAAVDAAAVAGLALLIVVGVKVVKYMRSGI